MYILGFIFSDGNDGDVRMSLGMVTGNRVTAWCSYLALLWVFAPNNEVHQSPNSLRHTLAESFTVGLHIAHSNNSTQVQTTVSEIYKQTQKVVSKETVTNSLNSRHINQHPEQCNRER